MASSDSEAEIFEVDRILEKRGRGKNVEYLIRWRGFGDEEDSWEPAKSIAANASDSIIEYNMKNDVRKTPRRLSRGRSAGAGDADTKTEEKSEEKSMNKTSSSSVTGSVMKTVTTTKTVTKTQSKAALSDTSSPEASPTVTRKSLRSQHKFTDIKPLGAAAPAQTAVSRLSALLRIPQQTVTWFQPNYRDLPIIVLTTCLLVIASSFYISGK